VRRRARETFVLGAERVFDEAPLDLRNEAEADHDPTTEADRTAPAEPAIPTNPPVGLPAGAEIHRASSLGSDHGSRRPRPPARAIAAAALASLAAALGLLLHRADDAAPTRPVAVAAVSIDPSASRNDRSLYDTPAMGPKERTVNERSGAGARRATDREHRTSPSRDVSTATPATATTATSQGVAVDEAPGLHPPAATSPPEPAVAEPSEPVQSAASVRQEFGP
jgi:hypothetical protein